MNILMLNNILKLTMIPNETNYLFWSYSHNGITSSKRTKPGTASSVFGVKMFGEWWDAFTGGSHEKNICHIQ